MNIVLYSPTANNRVLNANRELFRKGFAVCWVYFPLFILPIDAYTRQVQKDFVEDFGRENNRNYLPTVAPDSGRLIEIANRSIPGAYINGFYFSANSLSALDWNFRVLESRNQPPNYSGTEISKLVAQDIEKYSYELWVKNNQIPTF